MPMRDRCWHRYLTDHAWRFARGVRVPGGSNSPLGTNLFDLAANCLSRPECGPAYPSCLCLPDLRLQEPAVFRAPFYGFPLPLLDCPIGWITNRDRCKSRTGTFGHRRPTDGSEDILVRSPTLSRTV